MDNKTKLNKLNPSYFTENEIRKEAVDRSEEVLTLTQYERLNSLAFVDPQKKYLRPPIENKIGAQNAPVFISRVKIGCNYQATRYPHFKAIRTGWHLDLQEEERKRFNAGKRKPPVQMWDPTRLGPESVKTYLQKASEILGKQVLHIEAAALKYLDLKDYNHITALYEIMKNPSEIDKLIK